MFTDSFLPSLQVRSQPYAQPQRRKRSHCVPSNLLYHDEGGLIMWCQLRTNRILHCLALWGPGQPQSHQNSLLRKSLKLPWSLVNHRLRSRGSLNSDWKTGQLRQWAWGWILEAGAFCLFRRREGWQENWLQLYNEPRRASVFPNWATCLWTDGHQSGLLWLFKLDASRRNVWPKKHYR